MTRSRRVDGVTPFVLTRGQPACARRGSSGVRDIHERTSAEVRQCISQAITAGERDLRFSSVSGRAKLCSEPPCRVRAASSSQPACRAETHIDALGPHQTLIGEHVRIGDHRIEQHLRADIAHPRAPKHLRLRLAHGRCRRRIIAGLPRSATIRWRARAARVAGSEVSTSVRGDRLRSRVRRMLPFNSDI